MARLPTPASPYYSPLVVVGSTNLSLLSPASQRSANALSNIRILVVAFLAILATGGPTYSFGIYASTLKEALDLTQSQLETLGAASFAAGFLSWIPGLCVDVWGSQRALIVGGLGQCLGFCLYWWVATSQGRQGSTPFLEIPSSWIVTTLSLLSMLIFTSNNLVIGGVFKAIVISCGLGTKGKAVGAAKAYLGLGAGVFSSLFRSLFDWSNSDLDFLGMSAGLTLLAIVLPAWVGLPTQKALEKWGTKDESTARHYILVYAGLLALALVVVGSSAMFLIQGDVHNEEGDKALVDEDDDDEDDEDGSWFPEWLHGVLILLLWVGPILALFLVPTSSQGTKKHNPKILGKSLSSIRRNVRKAMEREETKKTALKKNKHSADAGSGERRHLLAPVKSSGDIKSSYKQVTFAQEPPSNSNSTTTATTTSTTASCQPKNQQDPEELLAVRETPQPIPDLTLMQMLQTIPAWLFLSASTILVGSGTMLTINMGQMIQSRGLPVEMASACLALFSVAQALARVCAGAVSEAALQWTIPSIFHPDGSSSTQGIPRPTFLVLSCAFSFAGHACLAAPHGPNGNLPVFVLGIVLTGMSFGALWPLMVLIVGDLFGTVNHGANYMFADGFTCAVGTLSIAKFLTEFVYEQHVVESQEAADLNSTSGNVCVGEECFHATHVIISGLCLVALCVPC